MAELTFAEISKLLKYEPETGKLYWLVRPAELFPTKRAASTWNSRYSGKEALISVGRDGYPFGRIYDQQYRAHRVAWFVHTGSWPKNHIDHINGDRTDNRIVNLRDVTRSENQRNQKLDVDNTSGTCGVCWHKQRQKWQARIKINGRSIHLGLFDDIDLAIAARLKASVENGFHPNHGRHG